MKQIRVNMRSKVANSKIRRERNADGRNVIIVPSATLPDNVVMNGGLYPAEEIEKSYMTLDNTPAPLGHPQINGQFVNASLPQAINSFYVGAYNTNVRREDGKVYLDKVIDVEVAERTEGGRRLIDAINAGQPIHTSTGLVCDRENTKGEGWEWVARNMLFDHDAILLDEEGAATPEQGVGMMVNGVTIEVVNADTSQAVMTKEESNNAKRRELSALIPSDAWLMDFSDETLIYSNEQKTYSVKYSQNESGDYELHGDAIEVVEESSWVAKFPILNRLAKLFAGQNKSETTEEVQKMDKTELEAILAANAEATARAIAEAVKPLETAIGEIQANAQQAKLDAEAAKRADVEKVLGKAVADALTGNALDEAHAKLVKGDVAALSTNSQQENGRDAYNTAPAE